jgi:hypothetical protein
MDRTATGCMPSCGASEWRGDRSALALARLDLNQYGEALENHALSQRYSLLSTTLSTEIVGNSPPTFRT